jgi:hypothetical protein
MTFKDPEKRKAYQRLWAAAKRAKNPETSREAGRKYRAKNLEIIRKKRDENLEQYKATNKRWREENQDRIKEQRRKRAQKELKRAAE